MFDNNHHHFIILRFHGNVKARHSTFVEYQQACPIIHQNPGSLHLIEVRCYMKCRVTIDIHVICEHASLEKKFRNADVSGLSSPQQGRPAHDIRAVDVGTHFQEYDTGFSARWCSESEVMDIKQLP